MRQSESFCISFFQVQLLLALLCFVASAQEPNKTQESTDVLRINIQLVQTDVMVFDKQGRFIEGLQPDQFALQVNGKRQSISFFESIRTGSENEQAQLIAARGGKSPNSGARIADVLTSSRGRTILFYVDDLHITPGSISRIRKTLADFIDNKLDENDQVAITSASGRIGFLQQLTDNKAVLRAAAERITYTPALGRDYENPPMGEYVAMLIHEQHDKQLFDYFVDQTIKTGVPPEIARAIVERRAAAIVRNSAFTNKQTLVTLANLMQSIAKVPGRKLVFFISEGFIPNYAGSDIIDALHRATDAANAAGVVIYSLDARGLATDSFLDASSGGGFDSYGVLSSKLSSELGVTQEPLYAVASATGGRALVNTNSLKDSVGKALNDTSRYYLLAWRPDSADERILKSSKVKVDIAGHPEYEVKLRSSYLGAPAPKQKSKTQPKATATIEADAGTTEANNDVLGGRISPDSGEELPTSLSVGFKRSGGNSAQLVAFFGVGDSALNEDSQERSQTTEAQIVGVVFNSQGKPVGSFRRGVVIPKNKGYAGSNYQTNVPAGLYQVRVFARDKKSGRLGAAHQWVEIPTVKAGQLSLSSLYFGELAENPASSVGESQQVSASASRRFAKASLLRFTTYIYDAAHTQSIPDLGVQTRIARSGKQIVTTPEHKVSTDKLNGFSVIPYSAQFSLNNLPAGRYKLEVVVTDHAAKSSASQEAEFVVY